MVSRALLPRLQPTGCLMGLAVWSTCAWHSAAWWGFPLCSSNRQPAPPARPHIRKSGTPAAAASPRCSSLGQSQPLPPDRAGSDLLWGPSPRARSHARIAPKTPAVTPGPAWVHASGRKGSGWGCGGWFGGSGWVPLLSVSGSLIFSLGARHIAPGAPVL